jgi:hypothetical protein
MPSGGETALMLTSGKSYTEVRVAARNEASPAVAWRLAIAVSHRRRVGNASPAESPAPAGDAPPGDFR